MSSHWRIGLTMGLAVCASLVSVAQGNPIKDATTTAKIETAFLYSEQLNPFEIRTQTQDGVVTLQGTVSSQTQKDIAEMMAKSVDGVKRVVNNISVASQTDASGQDTRLSTASEPTAGKAARTRPAAATEESPVVPSPGGRVQDAATTAAIVMRLEFQEGLDSSDVHLSNRNGRVTVEGTVPSEGQRSMVLEIIGSTRGVQDIVDELRVTGGQSRASRLASSSLGYSSSSSTYYENRPEERIGDDAETRRQEAAREEQSPAAIRQGYPRPRSQQPNTWEEVAQEQQDWADELRGQIDQQRMASREPSEQPVERRRAYRTEDEDDRPNRERADERSPEGARSRATQPQYIDLDYAQAEYERKREQADALRDQADEIRAQARESTRQQRARLEARLEGLDEERAEQIEDRLEQNFRETRRHAEERADALEEQADRLERDGRRLLAQARNADRARQERQQEMRVTQEQQAAPTREDSSSSRVSDRMNTARENFEDRAQNLREQASETAQRVEKSASDEWIEKRLEVDLMLSREVSIWDLNVEVENGVAYLTGNVDSTAQRQAADRIARRVDGIRGVNNNIRVRPNP